MITEDPLALLVGMVLDQQIPLERGLQGPPRPHRATRRAARRCRHRRDGPGHLVELFCARPALHRFPAANAKRVRDLCRIIVDQHHGDAAAIWTEAKDGADLLGRVRALPGFGEQKARIFVGLLGKQLGVRPTGWRQAAGRFGEDGDLPVGG